MFSFHNFSGTIMRDNIELIHFKFNAGQLIEVTFLREIDKTFPYEFVYGTCDKKKLCYLFLKDRIVPETRIGINEELESIGLYYDPVILLRFNHGVAIDDSYWVKEDGETITWEDVKLPIPSHN